MRIKIIFLLILSFLLVPSLVWADGGMIMWPPDVHLGQQSQSAIAGWNNGEEVLILSNDIESDASSTVLRIVPLPSEPEVEQGSFESFENLEEIMNEKYSQLRDFEGAKQGAGAGTGQGVELTFQKEIGSHQLTVVKVNDVEDFVEWIEDFTEEKNLSSKKVSDEFKSGVENYLKREINYFVFDVITVKAEKSIKPLVYEFNSDYLYYPVLMTGASELSGANTTLNLFVVFDESGQMRFEYPWGSRPVVQFSQSELEQISDKIAQLFTEGARVREVRNFVGLDRLKRDFIRYPYSWEENLKVGSQGERVKALQKILINQNFWNSEVRATGYYGSVTKKALKNFQEAGRHSTHILSPLSLRKGTGYFGPKTREFFANYSVEGLEYEQDTAGACEGINFDKPLKVGVRGQKVKCLQVILNERLDKPLTKQGPGSPGNETSYFGSLTKAGVKRFQKKFEQEILAPWNLSRGTGFVGKTTREKLNELSWEREQKRDRDRDQDQDQDQTEGLTYCESDSDCVLVNENCCSCSSGGSKKCINKQHEESWRSELNCEEKENMACPMVYLCGSLPSGCECVNNSCQAVKE